VNRDRVLAAQLGRGSDAREASRQEAVELAARKLKAVSHRPELAVVASPVASNEDLLACLSLAKEALGAAAVYVWGRPDGAGDRLLVTLGKNTYRGGAGWNDTRVVTDLN